MPKDQCAIAEAILSLISSFCVCILYISLILLVIPPAMCADIQASLPGENESAPIELLVLIEPSQAQASPGDAFNVSYFVINLGNFTMMNVTLVTVENGTVDLNTSVLLPRQSAGGNEVIMVEDRDQENPIIRRARAQANDPVGTILVGENITSIYLNSKGVSL